MASQLVVPTSYSIYAPLRFEVTRKYSRKAADTLCTLAGKEGDWPLRERLRKSAYEVNKKYMDSGQVSIKSFLREVENLIAYVEFSSCGRIIYDFHKSLTNALLLTDVDKIAFDEVPFPLDNFYLHFGDMNWPDNPDSELEGIYVSKKNCIVGTEKNWCFTPIYKNQFSVPLHLKDDIEARNSVLEFSPSEILVGINEYCQSIADQTNQFYNDMEACSPHEDLAHLEVMREWSIRDRGNPKENSMITKLAINCMLYLAAAPDDEVIEWDERAPSKLVHQATHSEKSGARLTAENTLNNLYYLKIRKIGEHFAHLSGLTGEHNSGRKISHIRKGHFRYQAFGHEWKEHRTIFIAPQIIHPEDPGMPGRIYEV